MENIENNVDETIEATETETENKTYTQDELNEILKGYKTQDEVNKIVEKRLARDRKDIEAKIEAERKEAAKLAKMSEQEKLKHDLDKKIASIEAREKDLARKELAVETDKQLKDLGISSKATKWVLGDNAENTHENIKEFESFVQELKEDIKKELLKGKTPKTSTAQSSNGNPYVRGESWSLTKQMELEMTNPTLARQLKESAKK